MTTKTSETSETPFRTPTTFRANEGVRPSETSESTLVLGRSDAPTRTDRPERPDGMAGRKARTAQSARPLSPLGVRRG